MRYAMFMFAAALFLWAVSISAPVLACGGHGPAVAASINDFFSQMGEEGEEAQAGGGGSNAAGTTGQGGDQDVDQGNGNGNGRRGNWSNDSASWVLRQAFQMLGGSQVDNNTYSVDYNG